MMRSRGGSRLRGEVKSSETRVRAARTPGSEETSSGAAGRRDPDPVESNGPGSSSGNSTVPSHRSTQSEALREDVLGAVRQAVANSALKTRNKFEVPKFDIDFVQGAAGGNASPPPLAVFPEREAVFPHPANENFPPKSTRRLWPLVSIVALVAISALAILVLPWMPSQSKSTQAASEVLPRIASAQPKETVKTTPAPVPLHKTVASMVREAENKRASNRVEGSRSEAPASSSVVAAAAVKKVVSEERGVREGAEVTAPRASLPSSPPVDASAPTPEKKSAALPTELKRLAPAELPTATKPVAPASTIPAETETPDVAPENTPELTNTERANLAIASARKGDPAFTVVGTLTPARIEQARAEYARAAQLAGPQFPPLIAVLEKKSVVAAQSVASPVLSRARGLSKEGRVREARTMMESLAFANIPEVSFAIARSYDPTYLAALPTHDAKPSIKNASDWYRRWHTDSVRAGQVSVGAAVERLIQVMKRSQ